MKPSTALAFASFLATVVAKTIETPSKCLTTTTLPTATLYACGSDIPTDVGIFPTGTPQPPVSGIAEPGSDTEQSGSSGASNPSGGSTNNAIPSDAPASQHDSTDGASDGGTHKDGRPESDSNPGVLTVSGSARFNLDMVLLGLVGLAFI
ncbi:hypothetical protein FBEOM_4374 [Fusarium beomiforme]|uniref:Uncharacterized protein n=1 Tax=Fusarium beomiforme TaxID=44412 RepID=A0A9P5AN93_9HYPO|nr:hypothetical protein FBEOM_4374 [Fusarium beomiforme]